MENIQIYLKRTREHPVRFHISPNDSRNGGVVGGGGIWIKVVEKMKRVLFLMHFHRFKIAPFA